VSQKCAKAQLHELHPLSVAENSDLFAVLTHVAQALPPLLREERTAKSQVGGPHPLQRGVEELDQDKLTPLGRLRNHNSIQEAVAGLGRDVGKACAGLQKHLYQDVTCTGVTAPADRRL
jgi:type I restriction enzyme R subunit